MGLTELDNSKAELIALAELNNGNKVKLTENQVQFLQLFSNAIDGIMDVVNFGSVKHGELSWLNLDNPSLQDKANDASLNRHNAHIVAHPFALDPDTGRSHHAHGACRHLMKYERLLRGIDTVNGEKFNEGVSDE